jgi:hypothetical protein
MIPEHDIIVKLYDKLEKSEAEVKLLRLLLEERGVPAAPRDSPLIRLCVLMVVIVAGILMSIGSVFILNSGQYKLSTGLFMLGFSITIGSLYLIFKLAVTALGVVHEV